MTYRRLAYDDAALPADPSVDCRAVEDALHLPRRRTTGEQMTRATVRTPPSILFEDYPSEITKTEVAVPDAAARLGAAMHLHLD